MPNEKDHTLQVLCKPSKKAPKAGDLFRFRTSSLPDLYIFNRVIVYPAQSGSKPHAKSALIFTYDACSSKSEPDVTLLRPDNLLIEPTFVNRLRWSRGYWETFGNIPVTASDKTELLYFARLKPGSFVRLDGEEVREKDIPKDAIIGSYGLGNFNILEYDVVAAFEKRAQHGA